MEKTLSTELTLVAVDTGGSATKFAWQDAKGDVKASDFLTRIKEIPENSGIIEGEKIVYEGKTYQITENIIADATKVNTKLTEKHILCTYVAIAKSLAKMKKDPNMAYPIYLAINVPVSEFKKQDAKDEYVSRYQGKTVKIILNGVSWTFSINQVIAYFEGQGSLFRNAHKWQNKEVLVIDLGGRNDTMALFKNRKPQSRVADTGTDGLIKELGQIALELSQNENAKITLDKVKAYKLGQTEWKPETFEDVFDRKINEYMENLKNRINTYELNFNEIHAYFTGGGAMLLEHNLKEYFKDYFKRNNFEINATDGVYDNVKGALEWVVYQSNNKSA